jgi:hypothetical protein
LFDVVSADATCRLCRKDAALILGNSSSGTEVRVGALFARLKRQLSLRQKRRERASKHNSLDNDGSFLHTSIGLCRPGLYTVKIDGSAGLRLDQQSRRKIPLPAASLMSQKHVPTALMASA